jgi:predicted acyl esterase
MEPWVLTWLRHQRDGAYWRHGSLRPAYERITCATMLVGGWADGYRNNSLRTFEALRCPKSLLMGPWSHMSTETALPGPHIDLVPEMIRWFGCWLRDEETGVDREPPMRLFVRHATRPEPDLAQHEGVWRYEPAWPLERSRPLVLTVDGAGADELAVRPDVGVRAWISCAGHLPWGQSQDLREDDAWSLTYDWPVESGPLEILGYPCVRVRLRSDAPIASLSAKLEDVFPDGTSALVTRGFLNLTHRNGSTEPSPLPVDEDVEVGVELEAGSYVFPAGHRVRLALAGTDWPNTWPPPTPVTLTVERSSVCLELQSVDGPGPMQEPPPLRVPARHDQPDDNNEGADSTALLWRLEHDVLARCSRAVVDHGGVSKGAHGAKVTDRYEGQVEVSLRDPGRSSASARCRFEIAWPDVTCAADARMDIVSDAERFEVSIDLELTEDGRPFTTRHWTESIGRDLL